MKFYLILFVFFTYSLFVKSQKVGFVTVDSILFKLPQYKQSLKQLNNLSLKWQSELDKELQRIKKVESDFELEKVFLTDKQIELRQNEIELRYSRFYSIQKKRFGPNGHLDILRIKLVKPIQDVVYDAIEAVSKKKNFSVILEKNNGINILYGHKRANITEDVMIHLGYSKETGIFKNKDLKRALQKGVKDQFLIIKDDVTKSIKGTVKETKENIKKSVKDTKGSFKKAKDDINNSIKSVPDAVKIKNDNKNNPSTNPK